MIMKSAAIILKKIISDEKDYCGLCFEIVVDEESFNLDDEILLDSERTNYLYEILVAVVGNEILKSVTTSTICKKCFEMAFKSYNFIINTKHRMEMMAAYIDCLQKHTKDELEYDVYKSVFVAINVDDGSAKLLYDDKNSQETGLPLYQRYLHLQTNTPCIESVYSINVKLDSEDEIYNGEEHSNSELVPETNPKNDTPVHIIKHQHRKKKQPLSIQLSEIPHEKIDDSNYKCTACSKIFTTMFNIKEHYVRVHAPKNNKCTACPRSFGSKILLNRHIKGSHCNMVCAQCGKTYTNVYSLRHHELSHNARFECPSCGKVYRAKHSYKQHIENSCVKIRNLSDESKFVCNYCGKKYSQKTALSVHIRVLHENGKSLTCDWCGKKVSSISRLKNHILTHTKQKDFNCEVCGGKFVTKASLIYHTRTHTGEKPYVCEHCGMRFLSASRRSRHLQMQHDVGPELECDVCHEKYIGKIRFMKHRKKHFSTVNKLCHKHSDN